MGPGVGLEWWLSWFAHPFRGHVQRICPVLCFGSQLPSFVPGLQKWRLVVLGVFLYLVVHSLTQLHMHAVIFSPLQFLPVLLFVERCVQMQALQRCSQGSQVPVCHPISVEKFRGWILEGQ